MRLTEVLRSDFTLTPRQSGSHRFLGNVQPFFHTIFQPLDGVPAPADELSDITDVFCVFVFFILYFRIQVNT